MTGWTSDELTRIGTADELELASVEATIPCATRGPSGSSACGEDLYVRSMNGRPAAGSPAPRCATKATSGPAASTRTSPSPTTDPDLNDQVDAAYRDKYHRYGDRIVGGVVNPAARAATIKLVPADPPLSKETPMQTRSARQQRPGGLGDRARLHGHEPGLGPAADRRQGIAVIRAAVERGVTLLRHRRGVRPVRQRGARRRGPRPVPRARWSSRPSSGSDFDADGPPDRPLQPPGAHPPGRGRLAPAARRRRPSTCSTSTASTPSVPIEDVAGAVKDLIGAGKVTPLRPVRGRRRRRSAAPTPSSRSPPCRASTRCGGANPRRRSCRPWRSSASASSPSARSARGSSPARSSAGDGVRQRRHPQHHPPLHPRGPEGQPGPGRPAGSDRGAQERHPGPGRAGLAARPEAVDRADPRHPPSWSAWRRTSAPPTSS